jgi:hypothetical protein
MLIPLWIIGLIAAVLVGLAGWLAAFLRGRNPLPFPDGGSRIFTTPSPEAKSTVVALLRQHGLHERFQFNSAGVLRSILWDGTIINISDAMVLDAEPELPIAFVVTNVFSGTVLNFRKHVRHLPRPTPVRL